MSICFQFQYFISKLCIQYLVEIKKNISNLTKIICNKWQLRVIVLKNVFKVAKFLTVLILQILVTTYLFTFITIFLTYFHYLYLIVSNFNNFIYRLLMFWRTKFQQTTPFQKTSTTFLAPFHPYIRLFQCVFMLSFRICPNRFDDTKSAVEEYQSFYVTVILLKCEIF